MSDPCDRRRPDQGSEAWAGSNDDPVPERVSPASRAIRVDLVHDAGAWPEAVLDLLTPDDATSAVAAPSKPTAIRPAPFGVLVAALAGEIELGDEALSAAVALSDDANVATLNRRYRDKDGPTNVLSFPAAEPPRDADGQPLGDVGGAVHLGDIVLALETVSREAAERAIPFDHHLQHLVLHGLLHLLGFDHETPDDAEEMESIETAVLARLTIPNPYSEEAGQSD